MALCLGAPNSPDGWPLVAAYRTRAKSHAPRGISWDSNHPGHDKALLAREMGVRQAPLSNRNELNVSTEAPTPLGDSAHDRSRCDLRPTEIKVPRHEHPAGLHQCRVPAVRL